MSDCGCDMDATTASERRTLYALLSINAAMFVVELVAGLLFASTGLLADSLDMLADASVYVLSLYAVGRAARDKTRAARLSGVLQVCLGLVVLADVLRRFYLGSAPDGAGIVGVGAMALVANLVCLALIAKHRRGEVHMRASWIFSLNDVLANVGVIVAGFLVAVTASNLPDLVVGLVVSVLVVMGGRRILREAAAADSRQENSPGIAMPERSE